MPDRTITYAVYSEAGGVGKSTLAASLAAAHARDREDVLLVDLDQQEGSVSHLLDVDDASDDREADNLARHMIGRPRGPFDDLLEEAEFGIDVVPSHDELEMLPEWLIRAELQDDGFERHAQLLRVLREAGAAEEYSTIIVDPPATAGPHLYNGIYAMRSIVLPVELSGKGEKSIAGLDELVAGLSSQLGIDVGVLAAVPNEVKNTSDQAVYREELEALGYDVPVVLPDRTSLMEGCWRQQCTPFTYVEEYRSRKRDYEMETLAQIEDLAEFINQQVRGQEVLADG